MITSILALLMMQQGVATPPEPPAPQVTCTGEGFDAFDFWVGEWMVFPTGSETAVATSLIERLYGGCAIRENWMPQRGFSGGSLSSFDVRTGRWQQTWVGGRGRVDFEGGALDPDDGPQGMVLTGYWPGVGGPGVDGLVRMTYEAQPDGSVRQHGEVSFDHGLNWADSFDFTYRRRAD